jgi:glycosyltransferase involved in cell wall biosynthesis
MAMPQAYQGAIAAANACASKSILVEGWRATNHSLALVNQHQLLELRRLDGLRLFHRDAALHFAAWKRDNDNSGFSPADRLRLDALTDSGDEEVDCVYRIFSPFQASAPADRRKTVTFVITEMGFFRGSFALGSEQPEVFTRDDNQVVTATRWSRDRLIEFGFAADKISIVPHGVDSTLFQPLGVAERQATRRILGIGEDEIAFLNVGAGLWNKGVDLLLVAFAHLRKNGRRIRLILRDRVDMYGFSIGGDIRKLASFNPGLFTTETMAAITVIQDDLSRDHLRHLYAAVDCYVSPYRAEGFNLPVLEAIACGTPVIVTRGGATDDFCDDEVAVRVNGKPGHNDDPALGHHGRFITPNMNDLLEAMDCFATSGNPGLDLSGVARDRVVNQFSWRNAALRLAEVTVGYDTAHACRTWPANQASA